MSNRTPHFFPLLTTFMTIYKACFILLLLVHSILLVNAVEYSKEATTYITDSENWPEFVTYTGNQELQGSLSTIPSNTQGTLIRVESYGRLLVDFGRYGRVWLAPEQTDFRQRYESQQAEGAAKFMGNLVRLIGPRLLTYEGELLTAYAIERLMEQDLFLLVYASPAVDRVESLAEWGRQHSEILAESNCQPVFMPTSKTTDAYLGSLFKKERSNIPFMRSHLSPLYVEVLQHLPADGEMTAVLLDRNGRILGRSTSVDANLELKSILDYLSEIVKLKRCE